ncbi:hypothetical protein PSV08DRAFT_169635, partial [Bipolaris maydis]|uniref:uncharacterized protein n=1 Tax=Cochliobolus heterostrophus TaxID=5016 RepID=UPI0024CEE45E
SREEFKARQERYSSTKEEEDYRYILLLAKPSLLEYILTSSLSRSNYLDNKDVILIALLTNSIISRSSESL